MTLTERLHIKQSVTHAHRNKLILHCITKAFDVRSPRRKLFLSIFLFLLKPTCSAFNSLVEHQYFCKMKFQLSFKVPSNASHVCLTTSMLRMSYQVDYRTIYWSHMSSPAPYDSDIRPLFQT